MSLVGDVIAYVAKRRKKSALIGGEALAVHGIARATLDSDLLVARPEVLRAGFWSKLPPPAVVSVHPRPGMSFSLRLRYHGRIGGPERL